MSHLIIRGTLLPSDSKIDWIAHELSEFIKSGSSAHPLSEFTEQLSNSSVCPIYYGETLLGIANVEILLGAVTFTGYVRYDHPVRLDLQLNEEFWSTCDYFMYCVKEQKIIQIISISLTKERQNASTVTLEVA